MPRKVLITGGAGFVGHHLTRLLLENGCSVLVLDDFSVGTWKHIAPMMDQPGIGLVMTDLTNAPATAKAVARFQPDVVFHLAALHFIPYCSAHPSETVKVNVLGTQHLLEAVRNTSSVKKFVFASTADIYKPQDGPNVEDETPTGSANIYGITKLFGEDLIQHYRRTCLDTTFVIARFFNIYGPGDTNPHVLPDVLSYMAAESDTLPLGNVDAKRDYVYVTDVAEALWALADDATPAVEVNVATAKEYSVRELVDCIAALTGRRLTITQDPAKFRPCERMHLVGDIGKIRRLTGWTPTHTLTDGLAELLAHEGLIGHRRLDPGLRTRKAS